MSVNPQEVERALKKVRHLIERVRQALAAAMSGKTQPQSSDGPRVVFITEHGGAGLSGAEADLYYQCLDALASLHKGDASTRILSRAETDRLVREAILYSLKPAKARKPGERTTSFVRRTGESIRLLRQRVLAKPTDWEFTALVRGAVAPIHPFRFGNVRFARATPRRAHTLSSLIVDYEPPPGKAPKVDPKQEQKSRDGARKEIRTLLTGNDVLATARVRAIDDIAARDIGMATVRRALDVLNFFAPFLHERPSRYRAYVALDGARQPTPWILNQGTKVRWSEGWGERFSAIDLKLYRSRRAREIGVSRTSRILGSEQVTDLEARIVNALAWAGRAEVEVRPEQSFLLFAIALEALLAKRSSHGGVSERVRLRAAHVIGTLPETRKRVAEEMGRLYRLRSELVHAGDASALTEDDLKALRELVLRALTALLMSKRYRALRSVAEFETWLDERLLV